MNAEHKAVGGVQQSNNIIAECGDGTTVNLSFI